MGGGEAVIVAGLGCRRDCPAEEIVALVRRAAGDRTVDALAVPASKADAPALREAAARLLLPLIPVAQAALAAVQPRCPTRSVAALRATGVASVAEGAALAAAGPAGRLTLPRIASAGATCALAESP